MLLNIYPGKLGELIARDVIHDSDVRSLRSLLIETKNNPHTLHRRLRRIGYIPKRICEYHNAASLLNGQFVLLDTSRYKTLPVFLLTEYQTLLGIRKRLKPDISTVQLYDLIETEDLEIVISVTEFP